MIYIYGAGGFGREVATMINYDDHYKPNRYISFIVDDEYWDEKKYYKNPIEMITTPFSLQEGSQYYSIIKRSEIVFSGQDVVLGFGDPLVRERVYNKSKGANFVKMVSANSTIIGDVILGAGSVVCTGVIMTTNIRMGIQCHFNLNSTVGHDVTIGNFVTVSPGVNISGNVTIGDRVYLGTNSSVIEGITICNDVTIGAGAVVVKNITEPGTYVGVPAKKIK